MKIVSLGKMKSVNNAIVEDGKINFVENVMKDIFYQRKKNIILNVKNVKKTA